MRRAFRPHGAGYVLMRCNRDKSVHRKRRFGSVFMSSRSAFPGQGPPEGQVLLSHVLLLLLLVLDVIRDHSLCAAQVMLCALHESTTTLPVEGGMAPYLAALRKAWCSQTLPRLRHRLAHHLSTAPHPFPAAPVVPESAKVGHAALKIRKLPLETSASSRSPEGLASPRTTPWPVRRTWKTN